MVRHKQAPAAGTLKRVSELFESGVATGCNFKDEAVVRTRLSARKKKRHDSTRNKCEEEKKKTSPESADTPNLFSRAFSFRNNFGR